MEVWQATGQNTRIDRVIHAAPIVAGTCTCASPAMPVYVHWRNIRPEVPRSALVSSPPGIYAFWVTHGTGCAQSGQLWKSGCIGLATWCLVCTEPAATHEQGNMGAAVFFASSGWPTAGGALQSAWSACPGAGPTSKGLRAACPGGTCGSSPATVSRLSERFRQREVLMYHLVARGLCLGAEQRPHYLDSQSVAVHLIICVRSSHL